MAGSELQDLTADTAPASGDIVYVVVDPAGTPAARKMTVNNLLKAANVVDADATPGNDSVIATIDDPSGTPVAKKTTLGQAIPHSICIEVVDKDTALTTGDGKKAFEIPDWLAGFNLTGVTGFNLTASSSGNPSFAVYNLTQTADMLTTNLTIDATETSSRTAATAVDVDETNDDVAAGDIIRIDCDAAGTGTKGVYLTLTFRGP